MPETRVPAVADAAAEVDVEGGREDRGRDQDSATSAPSAIAIARSAAPAEGARARRAATGRRRRRPRLGGGVAAFGRPVRVSRGSPRRR